MAVTVKANENNDLKFRQGLDMGRGATIPLIYDPENGINTFPSSNQAINEGGNDEGDLQYITE